MADRAPGEAEGQAITARMDAGSLSATLRVFYLACARSQETEVTALVCLQHVVQVHSSVAALVMGKWWAPGGEAMLHLHAGDQQFQPPGRER